MPRFSARRTSRRYVYRRRRFGRGSFRLRSSFKRFYRRSGGSYRRRSFRKSTKRYRRTSKGVKKFFAVAEWRSNAIESDGNAGGAVRSFLLIGTQGSTTANQNALGTTVPVGTWGRFWRVPLIVYPSGVVAPTGSSTLLGPYSTFTNLLGTRAGNAYYCGLSQNETYRVGELNASTILPWAKMYRYIRVKKIHVKYVCKRVSMAVTGQSSYLQSTTTNTAIVENEVVPQTESVRRGGDMVWVCTNRTGPMVDEFVSDTDLLNDTWLKHTAYAEIRKNPQLRRKAVFRNDVAWGMRPVKFSFTPSVVVRKFNNSQLPLVGVGPSNEDQGILSVDTATNNSSNPSSAMGWRYSKAGWWPMVVNTFPAVSSNASGGASSAAAGAAGANLAILSNQAGTSYMDEVSRWVNAPMFGMFMGLQPTTGEVWPRNLLKQVSFELEFKGLRNFETVDNNGTPFPYFKDWGNLPTSRMY